MANWRLKELRGNKRRTFLKLMGACGAAYGLERSKLLNFLADEGGHGLAEAATNSGNRALAVTCGNGVYAWFQQLWPIVAVADASVANPGGYGATASYLYNAGHNYMDGYTGTKVVSASERPFFYSPDAPWFDHVNGQPLPGKQMTAFMAGNDETHTEFPESAAIVSGNASLAATVASIQAQQTSALVPVIGIDPVRYGGAQGAPDVVTAPSADGIVDLFNTAASQATLSLAEDQALFESYYNSLIKLRRAANRSSWQRELDVAKGAARLMGENFAAQLTPTTEDLDFYQIGALLGESSLTGAQISGLEAFGKTLITVAKAFKLNLSNSAIVGLSPGPTSEQTFTDPHDTGDSNANRDRGRMVSRYLGLILDAFYADLATTPDPEATEMTLDQSTVFFAWGDTPHTPLQLNNWPDATPDDSNWIYCMGQGHLKEGWYGSMDMNGNVAGWDPKTGMDDPNRPATANATAAGAAVAYAVSRGDMNKVSEYYVGDPIDGVIV